MQRTLRAGTCFGVSNSMLPLACCCVEGEGEHLGFYFGGRERGGGVVEGSDGIT